MDDGRDLHQASLQGLSPRQHAGALRPRYSVPCSKAGKGPFQMNVSGVVAMQLAGINHAQCVMYHDITGWPTSCHPKHLSKLNDRLFPAIEQAHQDMLAANRVDLKAAQLAAAPAAAPPYVSLTEPGHPPRRFLSIDIQVDAGWQTRGWDSNSGIFTLYAVQGGRKFLIYELLITRTCNKCDYFRRKCRHTSASAMLQG